MLPGEADAAVDLDVLAATWKYVSEAYALTSEASTGISAESSATAAAA